MTLSLRATMARYAALGVLALLVGCSGIEEPQQPEQPEQQPEQQPPDGASFGLAVSDPVPQPTPAAARADGGTATDRIAQEVTYVSLPPGTFLRGDTVTIRNLASGATRTEAMVDGGFDPIPILAAVGDTLETTIRSADGNLIARMVSVVPPETPPIVVRTEPEKGKVDVPLNSVMDVVFSEPVDPSTVTAETVQLFQVSTPVEGSVVLRPDGLVAQFTPAAPLEPTTSYSLIVTQGIRDLEGNTLESAVEAAFTSGSIFGTNTNLGTIRGEDSFAFDIVSGPDATDVRVVGAAGGLGFFWTERDGMIVVGIGAEGGQALGINDANQVVGFSRRAILDQPYLWTVSGVSELPTGAISGRANAINNNGQIVGWSWEGVDSGGNHAMLWTVQGDGTATARDLHEEVFQQLGFDNSEAEDITDAGHIVGVVGGAGGGAFLWDGSVLTMLDTPEGYSSWASGVAAAGAVIRVVGFIRSTNFEQRPVLWTVAGGTSQRLELAADGVARGVNDILPIRVVGTSNLGNNATLWTVHEDGTIDTVILGVGEAYDIVDFADGPTLVVGQEIGFGERVSACGCRVSGVIWHAALWRVVTTSN